MLCPRTRTSDSNFDDGFTLIETLVSIMLLALVVAFLPGLLQLGTRAMQSRTRLDAISAAGPARQFISQQLSSATSVLQRRPDGRLYLAFAGSRDELEFVAPASLEAQQSGMQFYKLALDEIRTASGNAGRSLTSEMRPYSLQADAPATRSVLMRDVTKLSFRYFGQRGGEDSARWHDEWMSERALPQLVEMRNEFANAQPAAERPLVVVLRLANGS
jgi:prepilin-type N-terminal cleavage/methylation domain-containing protein